MLPLTSVAAPKRTFRLSRRSQRSLSGQLLAGVSRTDSVIHPKYSPENAAKSKTLSSSSGMALEFRYWAPCCITALYIREQRLQPTVLLRIVPRVPNSTSYMEETSIADDAS